jgi:hypothetical protein
MASHISTLQVGQGMPYTLHREVGLPVIVHHDANNACQEAAAIS